MSKILSRTPAGLFMDRGAALWHWLPLMLGWTWSTPLETMLERAMRFCEQEAADCCERTAKFLRDPEVQKPEADELYWHNIRIAEQWGKRRAILLIALRALREVK